jgi:hypothetical protein
MAAVTSFIIAMMSASLWNKITAPDAGFLETFVYGLSGASGITTSMWAHRKLMK